MCVCVEGGGGGVVFDVVLVVRLEVELVVDDLDPDLGHTQPDPSFYSRTRHSLSFPPSARSGDSDISLFFSSSREIACGARARFFGFSCR